MLLLAKFDKIIVFSEPQKNVLKKLGVPEERQIIIPNGVNEIFGNLFGKEIKNMTEKAN